MHNEPEISKMFYTITEVSEKFGVNASLLRFWEKEFEILTPRKSNKGNRLYTEKDIENIRLVYHLVKERGFTLQGAKDKLKESPSKEMSKADAVSSLQKVRAFLIELKGKLD